MSKTNWSKATMWQAMKQSWQTRSKASSSAQVGGSAPASLPPGASAASGTQATIGTQGAATASAIQQGGLSTTTTSASQAWAKLLNQQLQQPSHLSQLLGAAGTQQGLGQAAQNPIFGNALGGYNGIRLQRVPPNQRSQAASNLAAWWGHQVDAALFAQMQGGVAAICKLCNRPVMEVRPPHGTLLDCDCAFTIAKRAGYEVVYA